MATNLTQKRSAHKGSSMPARPRARGGATKVDVVFEDLRHRILANHLSTDDMLPSERDLAAQFGVNRYVIREALGRLKGLGLLHTRNKWGTRLKSCSWAETLGAQVASLVTDDSSLQQMFDLRMAVEIGNAAQIIDKISDEQIADLRRQLGRMLEARTWAELLELDAEFHVKLLQVSGNPLVVEFAGVIVNYFLRQISYINDREKVSKFAVPDKELTRRDHAPIVEALEQRDTAKLIQAMKQHAYGVNL